MRRLMETNEVLEPSVMRNALGPTWKMFGDWTRAFAGDRLPQKDLTFFLLTVQSVLFVSMLDSPFVSSLLGGSIREPAVRARVRGQIIQLVETLLGLDGKQPGKGGSRG